MKYKFRKDKNALVVFDKTNGNKIRFAIGDYHKASVPELVDIKISDYCSIGCSFCYQNSGLEGKHGTLKNLSFVAKELGKAKVLEVALGGGETTEHPDFVEIVKLFHREGVVPNFTTKKPAAIRTFWPEIGDIVGGVAYSAETPGQIVSCRKLLENHVPLDRINLHYVMGLQSSEGFKDYMRAASENGFRVTLLGYKTSGRGSLAVHQKYDWWIDSVNDLIREGNCPTFSIDTPLAKEFQDRIPVSKKFFHTEEGKVSLYIDAVAMLMGASSFENLSRLIPFDIYWKLYYKEI